MTRATTEVLMLRHGQSVWNAAGRWQGWADPPLSELGERQAHQVAMHLAGLGLGAVVASDLRRARRTAEIIAAALDLGPVVFVPRLRERDIGEWSGLTTAEIEARWPDVATAWADGRWVEPVGATEGGTAFAARVVTAISALAARHRGARVVAVSHGGVVRALLRHLGVEPTPTHNLSGHWFRVRDGHLEPGEPAAYLEPDSPLIR